MLKEHLACSHDYKELGVNRKISGVRDTNSTQYLSLNTSRTRAHYFIIEEEKGESLFLIAKYKNP